VSHNYTPKHAVTIGQVWRPTAKEQRYEMKITGVSDTRVHYDSGGAARFGMLRRTFESWIDSGEIERI